MPKMALKLISPKSPIKYASFLQLQDQIVSQMKINSNAGYLLVMEHDRPCYTAGRRSHGFEAEEGPRLRGLGAEIHEIGRGGLVTWHGPGQLCIYPVLNLQHPCFKKSMHWYVKGLESVLSRACSKYGLKIRGGSSDCEKRVGAWTAEGKKIGFVGIKNTRWVTSFGASLNVNCDLGWFGHVLPCGLEDVQITSMAEELKSEVGVDDVRTAFIESFFAEFDIGVDKSVNKYTVE